MRDEHVEEAVAEARRFLEKAEAYLASKRDWMASRERSAMRRSSLDLSRSLSKMRARDHHS